MSTDTGGGPAFPLVANNWHRTGMTLRDYFAAHAPEPPESWRGGDKKLHDIIYWRWWYADAMLKARGQ